MANEAINTIEAGKNSFNVNKRTMRLLSVSVFTLFLVSFIAAASSRAQHMNQPDSPCAGIAGTSDLVACLSKARASSDAEMNALYQEIRKRLDASEAEQLIDTQRLWIKYRDANCSAERSLYGLGTGAGPAYLACLEVMTRERTKELRITYTVRLK